MKPRRVDDIVDRLFSDTQEYTGHHAGDLRRFWRDYLRQVAGRLSLMLIIMFLWGALPLALPLIQKFIIDDILMSDGIIDVAAMRQRLDLLKWAVFWSVFVYVLYFFFHWAYQRVSLSIGWTVTYSFRKALYEKLQRLHIGFFERTQTGRIMSRLLDDVNVLQQACTNTAGQLIGQGAKVIVAAIILFWLDWKLAALIIASLPVYLSAFLILRPRIRRINIAISRLYSRTVGHAEEHMSAIRVVKAFASERREQKRFAVLVHDFIRLTMRSAVFSVILELFSGTMTVLFTGIILYVGVRHVQTGVMSIGSVLAYLGTARLIFGPIGVLANQGTYIQYVLVVLRRVFALLEEPEKVCPGQIQLTGIKGKIQFDAVTFTYRHQAVPALNTVSFTLWPGERIALMGPSGAGKSTVLQLLLRFYDPQAGVIRVGGVDLMEADIASLRRHVCMVQQEPYIFSGTIAENILYGRPDAAPDDIRTAARQAELHDFIMALPEKYDTEVGERGMALSGGQKQRLALATALLTKPEVLLLDDTTSALDAETEAKIRATLERVLPGHTTLIVTQRIATARHCDRILVLEDGCLTQQGTHAELVGQDGFYRRIFLQQEAL